MLIKIDENLPERLAAVFRAHGHDVDTAAQEGLLGAKDRDVWLAAQRSRRFLVTQDRHFSDTRMFGPGTHAGILFLRFGNSGAEALVKWAEFLLETQPVEQWSGCFVTATDHKIRVARPSA